MPEFRPFFYVNVADINALENELSYVACKSMWGLTLLIHAVYVLNTLISEFFVYLGTTEKIFEEKKDLYDVYVDNQNVKTYREGLKPLLRLSAADKEKYHKLTEQRCCHYMFEINLLSVGYSLVYLKCNSYYYQNRIWLNKQLNVQLINIAQLLAVISDYKVKHSR